MKSQLKNLIDNNNVKIAIGCVIIFNGILHLAFGAAFISSGSPFSSATLKSILASNQGVKAVSGFTIVSGLFLILFPIFIYWNLSKNVKNNTISIISWFLSCLLMLFDFTSGVLTAQVYAPTQKYTNAANISISSYGTSINNTVNFALADCILTFILGLPATLFLITVSNIHRQKIAKINEDQDTNRSQTSAQPKRQRQSRKEEESEVVHHDLAIGISGGYNLSNQYQMNNNFGNQPHPFQVNMDYEPPSPQSAQNNQLNQVRYQSISPSFNERNQLQYSEPGLHHVQSQ